MNFTPPSAALPPLPGKRRLQETAEDGDVTATAEVDVLRAGKGLAGGIVRGPGTACPRVPHALVTEDCAQLPRTGKDI
jgi:hypothetical protein